MFAEFRRRFLRRRTVADLRREAEATALRRTLGAWHLVALCVGAIVGAGIFLVLGFVASEHAGPSVTLALLLVAAASAIVALAYAELASMVPVGGSGYAYATVALGELPAWLTGWMLVLSYLIGNGAVAIGFSANVQSLLAAAGRPLPAWLGAAPPDGLLDLPAALSILAITFLLVRPVKESVGATAVLVALKVLVLVVFAVAALPAFDPANLVPFAPGGFPGVLAGAALAFYVFLGFDTVSTAAEEARDPGRDLPIGIVGGLVVTVLLYVVVALAMTAAVPSDELGVADPLAEVMRALGNPALGVVMNLGGFLATFTVLIAFQFGGARIVLNLARDGFLPGRLAKVSPRTGTPLGLTYVVGVGVAVVAAFVPLRILIELTNVSAIAVFAVVLVALLALRRKEPAAPRPFRMAAAWPLGLLGLGLLAALLASVRSATSWSAFAAWMGLGLVVYALYRAPRTRATDEDAATARPERAPVPVAKGR